MWWNATILGPSGLELDLSVLSIVKRAKVVYHARCQQHWCVTRDLEATRAWHERCARNMQGVKAMLVCHGQV